MLMAGHESLNTPEWLNNLLIISKQKGSSSFHFQAPLVFTVLEEWYDHSKGEMRKVLQKLDTGYLEDTSFDVMMESWSYLPLKKDKVGKIILKTEFIFSPRVPAKVTHIYCKDTFEA